mgnify:CR=1 FL=1
MFQIEVHMYVRKLAPPKRVKVISISEIKKNDLHLCKRVKRKRRNYLAEVGAFILFLEVVFVAAFASVIELLASVLLGIEVVALCVLVAFTRIRLKKTLSWEKYAVKEHYNSKNKRLCIRGNCVSLQDSSHSFLFLKLLPLPPVPW